MSSLIKILLALFLLPVLFSLSRINLSLAADCNRNRPRLEVIADNGAGIGKPGEKLTYTIKVTNKDVGANCPTSRVNLSAIILNGTGWKYQFEKDTFTSIAPGDTKSTKLHVTSPQNAGEGPKTITVSAQRPNGAKISQDVTYNVMGSSADGQTTTPSEGRSPAGQKILNFKIGIDGIGTTPNIPIGGNKDPDNIYRQLNFRIYDIETGSLLHAVTNFQFTYNPNSEKFEAVYNIPSGANIPDALYDIYVDGPRFLRTLYPEIVFIEAGQTTDLTSDDFYLITGNIIDTDLSENVIDIMDYNVLLSCSIYSQDISACDEFPSFKDYSDLNDDGVVNEDDFTLWLKELDFNEGEILP
ncbi:MAG: hypothetical protein HYW63_04195 [Candidatus Levybacteria bacterium]|nr:hypothetical protein [Candidatus Levybacteria bacterium]